MTSATDMGSPFIAGLLDLVRTAVREELRAANTNSSSPEWITAATLPSWVPRRTFADALRAGAMPYVKIGRENAVRRADLEVWLASRQRPAKAAPPVDPPAGDDAELDNAFEGAMSRRKGSRR